MEPFDCDTYPIWTALVTPMTADGEIDRDGLKRLIAEQEAAGNALLLLGSTGESLNMSANDKMKVLSIAFENIPRVPVMVGLGGSHLSSCLEWVDYLEKLPVHSYLAPVPHYSRPGPVGQREWFTELLSRSTRGLMIYNVPSRTGQPLFAETLKVLAEHPRLLAVKEAGGDPDNFRRYAEAAPSLAFYSGDDPLLPEFVPLGARGLVSVAANIWPGETLKYCRKALRGELSPPEKILWKECTELLFHAGNPVTVKHLLWKTRKIESPVCLPPLSCQEEIRTQDLLEAHQKIQDWGRI